jgi:tRNA dimethylallyltransferase
MHPKTVIVLAGPTTCGKSKLAIALAQQMGGIIINADSMQVYKNLSILTARPSPADLKLAPHALYGVLEATQSVCSVAHWKALAEAEIQRTQQVPMIIGGTGLYIKALMEGLSEIPSLDPAIREEIHSYPNLHQALTELDPKGAALLNPNDTQRLIRALSVLKTTGKPLRFWQAQQEQPSSFSFFTVYINPPRALLGERAEKRLRDMFDRGALEEVKALNIPTTHPLFKAVGVRELKAFLAGELTEELAFEKALIATRQYIKRQQTWFNHQLKWDHQVEELITDKSIERILEGISRLKL